MKPREDKEYFHPAMIMEDSSVGNKKIKDSDVGEGGGGGQGGLSMDLLKAIISNHNGLEGIVSIGNPPFQ